MHDFMVYITEVSSIHEVERKSISCTCIIFRVVDTVNRFAYSKSFIISSIFRQDIIKHKKVATRFRTNIYSIVVKVKRSILQVNEVSRG